MRQAEVNILALQGGHFASRHALPELPRFQLFEFHDLPWCPAFLRDGITECLRVLSSHLELDRVIATVLRGVIEESGATRLVDLCSGSCGPLVPVQQHLADSGLRIDTLVTDRYPNHAAFKAAAEASGGAIRGHDSPVDAMNVPEELDGVRTLFNAFHHFNPTGAHAILKDAHDKRTPIVVFEVTDRCLARTLTCFIESFVLMLLALPRMRPRRTVQWLFTYLLPVLPVVFAWDGFVSCLRTYNERELRCLTATLNDAYTWRFGRVKIPRSPVTLTYMVGLPWSE